MNVCFPFSRLVLTRLAILQLLETLYRERILEPVEIHRLFVLKNETTIELRQLEVYEIELMETAQPSSMFLI